MKPFRLLDCVVARDERELTLYRRDDAFYIQIDGSDLMSSRAHGSEDELARLALAEVRNGDGRPPGGPGPRVLVGGLGMGFTLRAALDALGGRAGGGAGAEVVVAEAFQGAPFDAVLLDVDNGPEAITLEANEHLYTQRAPRRH